MIEFFKIAFLSKSILRILNKAKDQLINRRIFFKNSSKNVKAQSVILKRVTLQTVSLELFLKIKYFSIFQKEMDNTVLEFYKDRYRTPSANYMVIVTRGREEKEDSELTEDLKSKMIKNPKFEDNETTYYRVLNGNRKSLPGSLESFSKKILTWAEDGSLWVGDSLEKSEKVKTDSAVTANKTSKNKDESSEAFNHLDSDSTVSQNGNRGDDEKAITSDRYAGAQLFLPARMTSLVNNIELSLEIDSENQNTTLSINNFPEDLLVNAVEIPELVEDEEKTIENSDSDNSENKNTDMKSDLQKLAQEKTNKKNRFKGNKSEIKKKSRRERKLERMRESAKTEDVFVDSVKVLVNGKESDLFIVKELVSSSDLYWNTGSKVLRIVLPDFIMDNKGVI